jgi:hypothetical protein
VVSCNANVRRASQLQHAVQNVDSNCHFGCLTLVGLRSQCMTDDPFPAANIGFHQGTPVVPRGFLPTHAAMFGNHLQMPVTRCGRRLGRRARHRGRPRCHDDRGIGMAGSDLAVDAVLVVCTIAGQRCDRTINLVGIVRLTCRDQKSPKQDVRLRCRDCIPPLARRLGSESPQR